MAVRSYGYGYGGPTAARPAVLLSRSVPQDFRDRGQPKAAGRIRHASDAVAAGRAPAPRSTAGLDGEHRRSRSRSSFCAASFP